MELLPRGRSSRRLGPPCIAPSLCLKLPTPSLMANGPLNRAWCSSGRSGGQQGAKRRNRWSKCTGLTESMPDDCSEIERRYFFDSAGSQRHPRVARAPPPSRADTSCGGGRAPVETSGCSSTPLFPCIYRLSGAGSPDRGHEEHAGGRRRPWGSRAQPVCLDLCSPEASNKKLLSLQK